MNTIELWPRPVFGPISMKKFGNPAIAVPRWACIPSDQASRSVSPVRPRTRSITGGSVTRNPVP